MFYRIFLEKPERIEALLMLLHVSLLVRVLMRITAREKMLRLLSFHYIMTMDGKRVVITKNGKVDHLNKLLKLLGLNLEYG